MVLFVGDTPSAKTDPNQAFKGAACEKRLLGWIEQLLGGNLTQYRLVNRTDVDFDMIVFVHYMQSKGPIVALGNNASEHLKHYPHFKLPHPSGRNRLLNNKSYIDNNIAECKAFIKRNSESCTK